MTTFIRVDSSDIIGTGHVMRCLTLANKLQNVEFICGNHNNNLISLIEQKYKVHKISINKKVTMDQNTWLGNDLEYDLKLCGTIFEKRDIKLLIIDHYNIDYRWEKKIRSIVNKIMVIDDLANRRHDCDILLDQNFRCDDINIYKDLVPEHCLKLMGPQYVLLRDEFTKVNPKEDSEIKRIHISFGGGDPGNETLKVINVLMDIDLEFDIIIGGSNIHLKQIKERIKGRDNFTLYHNISNMAQVLSKADLCIGSSGTSSYERCALSIPSIIITVARNQEDVANNLDKIGAVYYLGKSEEWSKDDLINCLNSFVKNKDDYKRRVNICKQIVNIKGCETVVKMIT
jgi:UDP-2,4-diacetamido-2,4,6-trideoxy-beta-L-altropyranose hydrolase